jgi:hypothetical protein
MTRHVTAGSEATKEPAQTPALLVVAVGLSTDERRRLVAFRCWYSLRRQGVSRQEAEKLTFCKWLYDTRLQPDGAAMIAS